MCNVLRVCLPSEANRENVEVIPGPFLGFGNDEGSLYSALVLSFPLSSIDIGTNLIDYIQS